MSGLFVFVEQAFYLACSRCSTEEKCSHSDIEQAVAWFASRGWERNGHTVNCPGCVKFRPKGVINGTP